MYDLNVNDKACRVDVDAGTPLLWVLRDELSLTSVKFGCGVGACGACTIHLNGQAVRSCSVPVEDATGAKVVTIDGLSGGGDASTGRLHPLQTAWIRHQIPQCGYCQSGMIMAAAALLQKIPRPTDSDIDAAMTNLCRCGTYSRVRRAILEVASQA